MVWRPIINLTSDRLPIIISIEKPSDFIYVDNRTFVNFSKANWVSYTEFTEYIFNVLPIPTAVINGEHRFLKLISATTVRFIFAGGIPEIRSNFLAEATVLANKLNILHQIDPCDPRIRDFNFWDSTTGESTFAVEMNRAAAC